jgi:Outer membrane protein beta-barrel domain
MKRIGLNLVAAMLIVSVANAQTDKGDWMVGGNMTINTTSNNSQFTLQPSGGYFFAKNFAAGSELTLSFGKFGDEKTSKVGVGPFARYYFELKSSDFKPLIHADFTFANLVTKSLGLKTSNTVTSFFIGAGGAYFINSNVALEAVAGFNRSKVENESPEGGFLFRIGFQVHLLGHEVSRLKRD